MQNEGNIIDEINLMVIQNTINLENLDEIENADVYDNEIEDEVSPMTMDQQSQFKAPSSSKLKKGKGFDSQDDINKLYMAVELVANANIQ